MKQYLFLFNGYSSISGKSFSGGEKHAFELINQLTTPKDVNVSILVTATASNSAYRQVISPKVNYTFYPPFPAEKKTFTNNFALLFVFLYRIIITPFYFSHHSHLVASSHLFFDIWPLLFAGKRKTYTLIHHLISMQQRPGFYGWFTNLLESISLSILKSKKTKIISTNSKVTSQLINQYNFNPKLIITTSNGLDLKKYMVKKDIAKQYDLLFCGRLMRNKGIYDFINIVEQVHQTNPSLKACIVGEGLEQESISSLIKTKKLTNVITMLGFISEAAKIRTFHQSRLLIMCSHEEGWSIVTGEALACSVPVIAYALDDILPIWGQNQGVFWIDKFSLTQYAEQIVTLLDDKKLYQQAIKAGKRSIARYDWRTVIPQEVKYLLST